MPAAGVGAVRQLTQAAFFFIAIRGLAWTQDKPRTWSY
jgi:hypothetical protein